MNEFLIDWRRKWRTCTACPLGSRAYHHVVGQGDPGARILAVGEGPGNSEDIIGQPFVGEAGQLLRSTWDKIGLSVNEIFLTNLVACRPHDTSSYSKTRSPDAHEIRSCAPRLQELRDCLPRIVAVVTIGNLAFHGFDPWPIPQAFHVRHPASFLHSGFAKNEKVLEGYRSEWRQVKACLK